MLEAAYHKDGPNGQLPRLAEPISESSAGLAVEQTVESSPPDIRQTPNGASPSAVLPRPHQMERRTEPSDKEISLRRTSFPNAAGGLRCRATRIRIGTKPSASSFANQVN